MEAQKLNQPCPLPANEVKKLKNKKQKSKDSQVINHKDEVKCNH